MLRLPELVEGKPTISHEVHDIAVQPIIESLGYIHPLCNLPELEEDKPGISNEAYDIAVQLILRFDNIEAMQKSFGNVERGSVLVFLPGLAQITDLEDRLKKNNMATEYKLWVLPLHSTVTASEQRKVFDRPEPGMRKVILATNIAESSITVSDVKYVIDFCLTKNLVCDVETNFTSLQVQWAAKANCVQRMGRAGRVSDGRVYRFVTRKFYREKLAEHGVPEMVRCPLDILVLKAKLLNMGEPKAILGRALDPPLLDDIERTVLSLKEVGALSVMMNGIANPYDGDLTFIGRIMAKMPVSIQLTKLMLYGHVFGLLRDTIIIAACLSNKSFFSTPYRSNFLAYKKRLEWSGFSQSDCIAYLNAFKTWENKKVNRAFDNHLVEERWCRNHFIQSRRIRDVQDLVTELEKRLRREGVETPRVPQGRRINTIDPDERELLLKLLFCGAFYPNYFVQNKRDEAEANKAMSGHNHQTTVMVSGLPSNQGALYRKDVVQLFRPCVEGDAYPKVHFEESKAFVDFPRDPSQPKRRVVTAVLLALKMGRLRVGMTLNIMDHNTALERVQQLSQRGARVPGFGPDLDEGYESTRHQGQGEGNLYRSVKPPSHHAQTIFQIYVTYVVQCGHFWAHFGDAGTQQALQKLRNDINEFRGNNLTPLAEHKLKSGAYCLAPYFSQVGGDDCYYRARVTNVFRVNKHQIQVEVFFLDYGNSETLLSTNLKELDAPFTELPFQTFECELMGVKPSPLRCPTGNWSDAAKQRFYTLVGDHHHLYASIYSVVHGVWRVTLTREDPGQADGGYGAHPGEQRRVSINEQLIAENFADKAEESFLSKKSHKEREDEPVSARSPSSSIPFSYDEVAPPSLERDANGVKQTKELGAVSAMRLPTKDDLNRNRGMARMRGNQVKLNGPWSAYEMRFYGLTVVGSYREAKTEREGVNSVCVDEEPCDPHDRMMVAAFVGLNPTSESIIVRDTTVMPNIPGLLGVMALTFCPFAELRCDREKKRYTGVLCGLGEDPSMRASAFPDHDMEIDFDFNFSEEDLGMVNAVRMGIHVAIGNELTNRDWGPDAILKVQHKTREKLLKLVSKRREYVEKYRSYHPYHWGLIDEDDIKHPVTKESLDDADMPISLHCGIVFEAEEEDDAEVRQRLYQLRDHMEMLHRRARTAFQGEVICAACEFRARNASELQLHLCTMAHRDIEQQIQRELDAHMLT